MSWGPSQTGHRGRFPVQNALQLAGFPMRGLEASMVSEGWGEEGGDGV